MVEYFLALAEVLSFLWRTIFMNDTEAAQVTSEINGENGLDR